MAGDAVCSYDGIAYPSNGRPFQIASKANTATSSSAIISSSKTGISISSNQTSEAVALSSNATALFTGQTSAVPTNQNSALSTPNTKCPLESTTYIKIGIPPTPTETDTSYVSPQFAHDVDNHDPDHEIIKHIFTPVPVTSDAKRPISYGPEATPAVPVIVAVDRDYSLPILEWKGLSGLFKRNTTTSLQGTTGGTAAETGGPVQTGSTFAPYSCGSTFKGAGIWVIGFSTLVLTAVMV